MNYPTRFTVGSSVDPYRGPVVTNLPVDGQFQRQTGIEGNPDLVPETSEGRTLGFVLDVPYVDGLRVSVDYWKIDQENLIASPNAEEIRNNDAAMLLAATQAALARGIPIDQIDLGSGVEGAYAGDPLIHRSQTITAEDRALVCCVQRQSAAISVGGAGRHSGNHVHAVLEPGERDHRRLRLQCHIQLAALLVGRAGRDRGCDLLEQIRAAGGTERSRSKLG